MSSAFSFTPKSHSDNKDSVKIMIECDGPLGRKFGAIANECNVTKAELGRQMIRTCVDAYNVPTTQPVAKA